jgi:hypothetical protein
LDGTERNVRKMLKRTLAIGLSGLMACVLVGGVSAAPKPKKQAVKGVVRGAARHPDGCYSGVHRRASVVAGENAQEIVGYDFDVMKSTWNKPFVMKLVDGVGDVDLDITYYMGERHSIEDYQGGDPAPPASIGFETRKVGGEVGVVPKGAIYAIVCIYESEGGVGANASFDYLAGKAKKSKKKK